MNKLMYVMHACDVGCVICGVYNKLSLTNHSDFSKRGYFLMSYIARRISFCGLHGGVTPRNPPTACTMQDNVILNVVLFLT